MSSVANQVSCELGHSRGLGRVKLAGLDMRQRVQKLLPPQMLEEVQALVEEEHPGVFCRAIPDWVRGSEMGAVGDVLRALFLLA